MRLVLAAAALSAASALAGCATAPPDPALMADAGREVTCSGHDDCEVKWSRAIRWVLDNCAYRLQTQSEQVVSTMGPAQYDPRPAVTINKVGLGEGRFTFDFRAGCDNMFGCSPSIPAFRASFVRAVMGPSEPAAPPAAKPNV